MKFPFKFIVGANYGDEGKGLATDFANVPITKNLFITHLNELTIPEIKNKDSYTTIIESNKKFNE